MNSLFTRRSIRKYKPNPVAKDDITYLLKAAMAAPSAGNQQPWQFIVVDDKSILQKINELHPYAKMLLEAPLAIVVCGDLSAERHAGMWVQDCSAATQNILLAADYKGLGSCWIGIHPRAERAKTISDLLNIPDNILPFSIIAIGYPAESKEPNDRYSEDRVHYNRFS